MLKTYSFQIFWKIDRIAKQHITESTVLQKSLPTQFKTRENVGEISVYYTLMDCNLQKKYWMRMYQKQWKKRIKLIWPQKTVKKIHVMYVNTKNNKIICVQKKRIKIVFNISFMHHCMAIFYSSKSRVFISALLEMGRS